MNFWKITGVFAILGAAIFGTLVACTQEEVDAKMAQAKAMAAQVQQVAKAVCDVTPQTAALATAVLGTNPTTVAIATVATTICVTVKTTPNLAGIDDMAIQRVKDGDPCPGGVEVNGVCVPIKKDDDKSKDETSS